jgi:hypothetical protein
MSDCRGRGSAGGPERGIVMSGFTKTGVVAHDAACLLAEGVRQAAVAGVTKNAAVDSGLR